MSGLPSPFDDPDLADDLSVIVEDHLRRGVRLLRQHGKRPHTVRMHPGTMAHVSIVVAEENLSTAFDESVPVGIVMLQWDGKP